MITKPTIYTAENVLQEVRDLLNKLANDSAIIYLGELIEKKPYSMQRFSEWANKFKDDEDISETIAKIKGILETRAVVGGLKSTLNSGMTKFHLINNFDWRDKSETDITTAGEKLNTDLTPAMLTAQAAAAKAYESEMKKALLE